MSNEQTDEFAPIEAAIRERVADALKAAASDPALRLSGHSGISVTRLQLRAEEVRRG